MIRPDAVNLKIAKALTVHQAALHATALKVRLDNQACLRMLQGVHQLVHDFAKSFGQQLSVRVKSAGDGESLVVILKRSRLSFSKKSDHYRVSAEVETFIGIAWKFQIVKCTRSWRGGMVYSPELEASTTADEVIDFLIGKAVALLSAS